MLLIVMNIAYLIASPAPVATEAPAKCELSRADSAFIGDKPLYRDCAVDKRAERMGNLPQLEFRPGGSMACYKATVEFVVDENGMVESEHVRVTSVTSPDFAEAVINSLSQMRYRPAQKAGVPVRQIARVEREIALAIQAVGGGRASRIGPPC